MDTGKRIEQSLGTLLAQAATPECPPGLLNAVRHSVFPAGARVRPRLCHRSRPCLRRRRSGRDRCRGERDRTAALRLARARRPALFRRRADAPRTALGARGVRRMPGDARGRRADRAGVPGARDGRCAASAALARVAHDHGAGRRHARRHRGRAGLGMRNARRAVRLPARQDGRVVCRRHGGGRSHGGSRSACLARARRMARRGLPGGGRHPRRRGPQSRRSASRPAAMPRSGGPAPCTNSAWPAHCTACVT